jgi:hypothetical protein
MKTLKNEKTTLYNSEDCNDYDVSGDDFDYIINELEGKIKNDYMIIKSTGGLSWNRRGTGYKLLRNSSDKFDLKTTLQNILQYHDNIEIYIENNILTFRCSNHDYTCYLNFFNIKKSFINTLFEEEIYNYINDINYNTLEEIYNKYSFKKPI